MTATRYFYFEFSDGTNLVSEDPRKAYDYARENNAKVTKDGYERFMKAPVIMTKDGFKPGWNHGLGEYVGGRLDYERKLKQKGLVEVGKEAINRTQEKKTEYFDFETRKAIHQEYKVSESALDYLASSSPSPVPDVE